MVRVRKARRSSRVACGCYVLTGELIANRGEGWICIHCAITGIKEKTMTPKTIDADRCAVCGKRLPPFYLAPSDSPSGYVCPRCSPSRPRS
jgi:hypothetical protein